MQTTTFIWKNGEMLAWENAKTHVLTHGLHYGSAVFVGIRVYDTEHGPAIFKLRDHIERCFFFTQQLGMKISYTIACWPEGSYLPTNMIDVAISLYIRIYPIEETRFTLQAIYDADEAFCCGAAVEVTGIRSVNDQIIANGQMSPMTQTILDSCQQIVQGKNVQFQRALAYVNNISGVSV